MLKRCIDIGEYEVDVLRLLERRLNQTSHEYTITHCECGAWIALDEPGGMDALCMAIALLMMRDLSMFELAQLVDRLPLTLVEKQEVLSDSIRCARKVERLNVVKRKLKVYLEEEDTLHLSGYMRFRMPEAMGTWKLCVQSAMEELLLEKEYMELMGVLRAFVQVKPARIGEISLLLNPDGSCTLTDDSDARIDYEQCDPDRLVSVLVELAPERLTVYDLAEERSVALINMLKSVFAGRVRFVH